MLHTKPKLIALAVALALSSMAQANPQGGTVASGMASFAQNGSVLTITNTPGTVINWQQFNIQAGETTRFVQQSAASTVLNRVTGQDPSQILGTLQSNGRVFLVNPNGIVFGQGSRVDVAGLVASTLNISDADFQAGRLKFAGNSQAGVINQGIIQTPAGGSVYLMAKDVTNSGVIATPQGEIWLAAGQSVYVADSANPELRVEITAPGGTALNLGQIIAQSGVAGLYGAVVKQAGVVEATGAVVADGGRIFLKATDRLEVAAGSITSADAGATGNGGQIKAWSDNVASVQGTLTARGGSVAGNGGFIETSGRVLDLHGATVQASATNGAAGTWLIDPYNIEIVASGGTGYGSEAGAATTYFPTTTTSTIGADMIATSLNSGSNVIIDTAAAAGGGTNSGTDAGNITVNAAILKTGGAAGNSLTLRANRDITVNAGIGSTGGAMGVNLVADSANTGTGAIAVNSNISTNSGNISLSAGSGISVAAGLSAGAGSVYAKTESGNLTLNTGAGIQSGAAGNAIVLATPANLINNAGPSVFNLTGGGRFLVYANDWNNSNFNGLMQPNMSWYHSSYNSRLPTDVSLSDGANHFVFVQQPQLALASTSASKVYGDADPALYYAVLGRANGDSLAYAMSGSPALSYDGVHVGSHAINVAPGSVVDNKGYGVSFVSTGEMTITPRPITVAADAKTKVYGNADPALTYQVTGGNLVNGDALSGGLVRATGETVLGGPYTINQGTLANSDYSINYTSANLTIAPKVLTPGFVANNKVYDGAVSATGSALGAGVLSGDAVNFSYSGASFADKNVGTGKAVSFTGIGLSGADASNYALASTSASAVANITPAPLTLSTGAVTKTYDGTTAANGSAIVTGGALMAGDSISGGSFAFADKNAGTGKTVTASGVTVNDGNGGGNYAVSYANNTGSVINKATLTLSAAADSKVYDGTTNSAGAVSATGLQAGDTLSGLVQAFDSKNAGNRTLSVSGYSLSDGSGGNNYNVVTNSAAGSVTPKALSITGLSVQDRVYDGTATAGLTGASGATANTLGGVVGGDSVSLSLGAASFTNKNVGQAKAVLVTGSALSGADAANYTVTEQTGLTANITPATLTYSATTTSRTYGDANPALAGTVTGFVGGENLSNATTGSLAFASPATAGSNVGQYAINGSGLAANNGNYVFAQAAGNSTALTVNKAVLTVSADSQSKVYGDANPALIASFSGFKNGETLATSGVTGEVALSTSADALTHVGTASIAAGQGALAAQNYSFTGFSSGALSITPRPITVAADAKTKVYGSADPALTYQVTGGNLVNGDALSGGLTRTAGEAVLGGPYAISQGTLANSDYAITYAGNNLAVTPRPLTYTVANASSTYGTLATPGAVSLGNVVGSDSVSGVVAVSNGATPVTLSIKTPAGAYSQKVTSLTGTDASNYQLAGSGNTDGVLTVNPKTLTPGFVAQDKVYDGSTAATGSANLGGVLDGDVVTLAYSAKFADKNAGVGKAVTLTASGLSGADAGNYVLASLSAGAAASITPASLFLAATSDSKVYDGTANSAGMVSAVGLQSGDTLSGLVQAFDSKNAGGRTLSVVGYNLSDGNGGNNYNVVTNSATGSVSPKVLTPEFVANNKVYDGMVSATGSALGTGVLSGDAVSFTYSGASFADKNVGTGKTVSFAGINISGADASNYALSTTSAGANANITPAPLTLSTGAVTKTYDGATTAAGNAIVTGGALMSGDSISGGNFAFADKNAGTGKTVTVSGVTVNDGNSGNNYVVSYANNTGSVINKATLTLSAANDSKVYDGTTNSAGAVSATGLQAGDTLSGLTQTFDSKNAGNRTLSVSGYSLIDGSGGNNYNVVTNSAAGSVTPTTLTYSATTTSRTYGDANPAFAGTVAGFVSGENLANATTGSLAFASPATAGSNVGQYAVNGGGLAANNGNYVFAQAGSNATALTVTRAPLTVVADAKTKTAGAENPALTASVAGLKNGDSATFVTGLSTTAKPDSPAGAYLIDASHASAGGNYEIVAFANSVLTVTPQPDQQAQSAVAVLTAACQVATSATAVESVATPSSSEGQGAAKSEKKPGATETPIQLKKGAAYAQCR